MKQQINLNDKVALVTGAAQGNGRAIALGLARAGARVVVTDVNLDKAQATCDEITALGAQAMCLRLDIVDAEQSRAVVADVVARWAGLDILVNNAGILMRGGMDESNAAEQMQRVMQVNVQGTFNVSHACLAPLRASRGAVVNVASVAAFAGWPNTVGYSPSKGALRLFTQSLAAELGRDGVRVNAIAPGVIATEMSAVTRADPVRLQQFLTRIPLGRVGEPDELVGAVLFLASDLSSYVTGITLPVDGGFLAA